MDTRFIETFLRVAECGSIADAARRLNLTPAAAGQRIRTLERDIGAPLLLRAGRAVRLTEAGERIAGRAREIVQEVRNLQALATDRVIAGELRIGALPTTMKAFVPRILTELARKYPQLNAYVVGGSSQSLYQRIVNGDLDAAIMVMPTFAIPKTCDWRILWNEPLVVLAPPRMSRRKPHAILKAEPFIRYDRNVPGGRLADSYLRAVDIRPRQHFEIDSIEAIAALVDQGFGVSLVPNCTLPWPNLAKLARVPITDQCYARQIGVLWNRSKSRTRLVQAFLAETMAIAGNIKKDG